MKLRYYLSTISLLLIFVQALFAAPSGKITGTVTDAETGQPLPGVNVVVEGTDLGAATNQDGYYVILNVPPGSYTVRAMMIGYANYVVSDVRVEIGLTTTIDVPMQTQAISGQQVEVVAEKPVVTRDVSQSRLSVTSEEITNLPIESVESAVGLQAGIQGMSVRGGAASETSFMIDGLSLNDERSNTPYTGISLSSIKELQIETGGFNAEYGNLRSGLVNAVTKEGSAKRYNGVATVRYSPPAAKHFGPSVYDPYTYFTRPYMDPAVAWTGTRNGNWDLHTQNQYVPFEGWNEVAKKTLEDGDPSNDLTPTGAQRLYEWRHRRVGNIVQPDYNVDLGFGGPVPLVSEKLGQLRFYLSHRNQQEMLLFPLSRDSYNDNITQLKLTSNITPAIKLMITGLYGEIHSVVNTNAVPSGGYFRSSYSIAASVGGASPSSVIYEPGYYNPTSIYRNMEGIELTHTLSQNTYYELSFQRMVNSYYTDTTGHRNLAKKYEIIPGFNVDEAPYGYYGYPSSSITGMWTGGWMGLAHDYSDNSTYTLEGNFTSQFNEYNQLKTGFQFVYNVYQIDASTYNPNWGTWSRELAYKQQPYRLGVYLQDKIEVSDFIMNAGLRIDYTNPNGKWYSVDQFSELFTEQFGDQLNQLADKKPAESQVDLSPRLGVSHPITENSKLYFNYGHFRQLPQSEYRYELQRESNGKITQVGNPNLKMSKTVAYELGYEQGLFDQYLLKLAAFYKDITDQPTYTTYVSVDGSSVRYSKPVSDGYEDIRGFEFTFKKRLGRWISGFINYTYMVSTSGYFGVRYEYQNPTDQRNYLRENPYQERPHPQPYARANLDFHTPQDFGPNFMGFRPAGGWLFNVLANWQAGSYTTYNPQNKPGVVDNVQWRDTYNIDLKVAKRVLTNKKMNVELFVDISNLLNTKFLSYNGFSDNQDYIDYMNSLRFSWEEGVQKGNDRVGEYRDWSVEYDPLEQLLTNPSNDPNIAEQNAQIRQRNAKRIETKSYIDMPNFRYFTFLNPRDITVGIKINF